MRISNELKIKLAGYIEVGDHNKVIAGYNGIGYTLAEDYIITNWNDDVKMNSIIEAKKYAQDWTAKFGTIAILDRDALENIIIKHITVRLGARAKRNKLYEIKCFADMMGYGDYFADSDIELINNNIDTVTNTMYYARQLIDELKKEEKEGRE